MIALKTTTKKEEGCIAEHLITVYRNRHQIGQMLLTFDPNDSWAEIIKSSAFTSLSRAEALQLKKELKKSFPNLEEIVHNETLILTLPEVEEEEV